MAATISGGDKIEEHLKKLLKAAKNPATLRVGFLEGATYDDEASTPVAMVAIIQNYGSAVNGIPARPFFTNAVDANKKNWSDRLAQTLVDTDYDVEASLAVTGKEAKGDIQDSISSFQGAPLSPKTVAAKGFDKQLVDTGHMRNSVDYEVVSGTQEPE